MKTNSQQGSLFRFKLSSKQFPLPTQFRSFLLTYSTTCSTQTISQLQLKPRMLPDASEKFKINFPKQVMSTCLFLSHSVVNQQSQHQVPLCLQCHDGSYLSLSALQYLYCQANNNASGFNLKVTSQCKHPSRPTVPAHYRTSGVQLLTSYLTNVATKPRSLTKQTRPSRLSCQRFSNVATKPRSPTLQALMPTTISNVATKPRSPTLQVLMPTFLFLTIISRHDARLSSTTHCALRASRINYNLTNLSRCNSFS